jgi:hypothetical protein
LLVIIAVTGLSLRDGKRGLILRLTIIVQDAVRSRDEFKAECLMLYAVLPSTTDEHRQAPLKQAGVGNYDRLRQTIVLGEPSQPITNMEVCMSTLMIDDCKDFALYAEFKEGDAVARTYEKGIEYLKSQEWDLLLLDHDLGCLANKGDCPPPTSICPRYKSDCESPTGYDIMIWLQENPQHRPKKVQCISWNPVGGANIEDMIDRLGLRTNTVME